jgi:hypothetical protein
LALVPIIILFLSFTSRVSSLGYFVMTFIPFLFFFSSWINKALRITILPDFNPFLTEIFSKFTLPHGYIILALFFLVPFLYLIFFLDNKKLSLIFKLNLVFTSFYVFLWTISAF